MSINVMISVILEIVNPAEFIQEIRFIVLVESLNWSHQLNVVNNNLLVEDNAKKLFHVDINVH